MAFCTYTGPTITLKCADSSATRLSHVSFTCCMGQFCTQLTCMLQTLKQVQANTLQTSSHCDIQIHTKNETLKYERLWFYYYTNNIEYRHMNYYIVSHTVGYIVITILILMIIIAVLVLSSSSSSSDIICNINLQFGDCAVYHVKIRICINDHDKLKEHKSLFQTTCALAPT